MFVLSFWGVFLSFLCVLSCVLKGRTESGMQLVPDKSTAPVHSQSQVQRRHCILPGDSGEGVDIFRSALSGLCPGFGGRRPLIQFSFPVWSLSEVVNAGFGLKKFLIFSAAKALGRYKKKRSVGPNR